MQAFLKKYKEYWGVAAVALGQMVVYGWRLTDRFIDGRFHINWGPPFWLAKAQFMHQVNFFKAYLGAVAGVTQTLQGPVAAGWYTSHPQFIAIPLYLWTGLFGFTEAAIRSLPITCFVGASILWWCAWRTRHTVREANIFVAAIALFSVMIEFGSKLDQEPFVWFFVSLAALGYERFMADRARVPYLWMLGITGMMWSDWSGFVFGGVLGVALLVLGFKHKPSRKLMWYTLLAGVIGGGIVLLQTWLQLRGSAEGLHGLVGVYQYRSETNVPGFWFMWLQKQFMYFSLNYNWPVGYVGLITILWLTLKKSAREVVKKDGFSLEQFTVLIALGTCMYALKVPQATYVHIYYQIFYAAAVGAGLVYVTTWLRKKMSADAFIFVIGILIITSLWYGFYNWYGDMRAGYGVPQDMELLMQLRPLPSDTLIHAVVDQSMNAWLDNPNIVYYAGRRIIAAAPEQVTNDAYLLVINQSMPEKIQLLMQMSQDQYMYEQLACSPHFCILKRNANPAYGKKTK